jgi:hypothetical protein
MKRDVKSGIMMRGSIDIPDTTGPNSLEWRKRRDDALSIIIRNPAMEAIWDSDIVPDNATYMVHALLAEKIVAGEITNDDADLLRAARRVSPEAVLTTGDLARLHYGEPLEFGSKEWFDNQEEISF